MDNRLIKGLLALSTWKQIPSIGGGNIMLARNFGQDFSLGIILVFIAIGASAQQTVYRWVDKDGVVHFGDAPPDDAEAVETMTLTYDEPASGVPTAQPVVTAPGASEKVDEDQLVQPEIEKPPPVKEVNISNMTLIELDQRCDDARENKIAPLREAEIENCKQKKRNDPAWCERFNADFGEGGRTVSGNIRPRMFDDLPECVDALKERNRRGR